MFKGKEGLHYLSLFIIVCITMNLIMMCLFIKQGSSQVINKYKKQLKYEVTLSSDNGISIRDAKQLTTIKGVKTYNYEQLVNASSHTLKSVNTRLSFPRIRLTKLQEDTFLLAGYSSMTLIQDFNSKEYKLKEGRLLNKNDENTSNAVISYALAKNNNLSLGDDIQLNTEKGDVSLSIVGIYKNKVGLLSHLKPYNTIFIALSKAQSLSHTEQTVSSVTYYLNKNSNTEGFIKKAQRKPLDWNHLQLTSNDAQYNACVSIFENICDKLKIIPLIILIIGSLFLILICHKLFKTHNLSKILIIFMISFTISCFTSPSLSKYTINTYLSQHDVNMSQKETRKIKTTYTPRILIESIGITSIMYLETVIIAYKKKISA
ncbi:MULTISPECIES: ABC transporter permease [Catenibacterium]|uniref:ABC transporter permease n=1 Tax=Catenibacterium faecis TaxID=2764323 RepID=A0ABR7KB00_9FIRM|nr:ABC transporter permease [Catenibacterium faecis]MBC6009895.1 ABC transporter permease [Catenibacterium faecis]